MARGAKAKAARRNPWLRAAGIVLTVASVLVVMALAVTGYAGCVSPLKHGGVWGILPLCFPAVLLAAVVLLVVQCFFNRKGAVVVLAGMVCCAGPILSYSPLHLTRGKAQAGEDTFTLLTYNVFKFSPRDTAGISRNPALDYILEQDADIVCLQEAWTFTVSESKLFTREQLDTLHARYPHVMISGDTQGVLSRFPLEAIHLDANNANFRGGDIGAYRITLPSGRLVSVFNVHLNSIGLDASDKQLYKNITDLHREPLGEVRSQLLAKLGAAAEGRARQAQQLLRWIRLYGGPDAIVCGDFNDVPGCYTIRALEDAGFRDVYPRVGLGPLITYNDDRFYFCIDHVLSRGDLRPLSLTKGRLKTSDHYPLTVTFAVEAP